MATGPDAVLAELDVGPVIVRAVGVRVTDELREILAAGGTTVGDEIVEIRWGMCGPVWCSASDRA